MGRAKIFIADSHPIVRRGLEAVFSDSRTCEVVGEAGDGLTTLKGVAFHRPEIAIVDIALPGLDGIIVTERLMKETPGIKVIVYSRFPERRYAIDAFKAGAAGFVLKGSDTEELVTAVDKALQGLKFTSPAIADEIMTNFADIIKGEQAVDPANSLSLREREVLKLVAEGLTSREIGEKLFLSPSTVKSYRMNMMKKLGVKDMAGLLRAAFRSGIARLD